MTSSGIGMPRLGMIHSRRFFRPSSLAYFLRAARQLPKAPCGGEKAGPSPVDRGKGGPQRSMAVDARGTPLGSVSTPANRHDCDHPDDHESPVDRASK